MLEQRARQRLGARAALVDEIFRGAPATLPDPVAAALESLADARAGARADTALPPLSASPEPVPAVL